MKRYSALLGSFLLTVGCFYLSYSTRGLSNASTPVVNNPYVSVQDGHFELQGKPFYVAGTNNYYLNYQYNYAIKDVLQKAKAMGLNVIRMWGFLDGANQGITVIQPTLGVFQPAGYVKMDYALALAKSYGIKIILTLVNNWDQFGGMDQYVHWVLGSNGQHDAFYTNPQIIKAYENAVAHIINHRNSITGVLYRNDPTILSWELANEPEDASDPTGKTITAWAAKISAFIHHLDPHHMIDLGDEGWFSASDPQNSANPGTWGQQKGVDWDAVLHLPYISFGTYHLYPDQWKATNAWGNLWIAAHIKAARAAGKPALLEEFGIRNQQEQPSVYRQWIHTVYQNHGAGEMFWMLSGDLQPKQPYPNYDGYGVYYPSPTATVLREGAVLMRSLEQSHA